VNQRKDEIGIKGCEHAVAMVESLPIEHDDHRHCIGYVRSTLRWQANRIAKLEAAVRKVRAGDAQGPGLARLYSLVSEDGEV
jgi:hypothetical protein